MGFKGVGCGDIDWIELAQDTVEWGGDIVNTALSRWFRKRRTVLAMSDTIITISSLP
jgi:hypothetical protein